MEINENTKRFIGILAKIPMFQRLQPVQALEILKICKPRSFDDRESVVEHGSKSTEMYILLSGKLVVVAYPASRLLIGGMKRQALSCAHSILVASPSYLTRARMNPGWLKSTSSE